MACSGFKRLIYSATTPMHVLAGFSYLDPQYPTFKLFGFSLVGIGKFNLVFLWFIGGVSL